MSLTTAINSALKESDKTQFGFWLTSVLTWLQLLQKAKLLCRIPSGALARTILRSNASASAIKFSWVLVDAEHGFITDSDYYEV